MVDKSKFLTSEFVEYSWVGDIVRGEIITSFDDKTVQIKYDLSDKHYLQRSLYYNTKNKYTYEPDFTTIMFKTLKQGDTFIDIGANFGYFTLLASYLVGDKGHVYSFEPEQYNFTCLNNNIKLNNLKNITTIKMALGDKDRDAFLYLDRTNDGGHTLWGIREETINKIGKHEPEKQFVRETTLDNIIENYAVKSIKIIKIDAEGWDHNIMIGAANTIKRYNVPIILAEVYREGLVRSGSSERIYRRFMKEFGYDMYTAHPTSEGNTLLTLIDDKDSPGHAYNAIFSNTHHLMPYTKYFNLFD